MNSWFSAESFSGLNLPLLSDWGFLNTKFRSCFFHSNFNFINISSALIGNFYEPSLFPRMLVAKPPSYPTAVTAKPNLPLILLFRWCNDVARSKFDSCQLIDDCWLEQYCWWNHKAGYSKSQSYSPTLVFRNSSCPLCNCWYHWFKLRFSPKFTT